jgi:hypothetical protein
MNWWTKLADLVREIVLQTAPRRVLIGPEVDVLDRNLHLLHENVPHCFCVGDGERHPANIDCW